MVTVWFRSLMSCVRIIIDLLRINYCYRFECFNCSFIPNTTSELQYNSTIPRHNRAFWVRASQPIAKLAYICPQTEMNGHLLRFGVHVISTLISQPFYIIVYFAAMSMLTYSMIVQMFSDS